jgi:tetratricopeptide (TPR) repeat protein
MENDNLRAALKWSTNEPGDAQTGLRLAASLERFWTTHGLLPEGHVWLEKLLARAGVAAPPAVRAKALYGYGQTAYFLCDYATARAYYEQSLVIDRELDNKPGIAQTLNRLGFLYGSQLEYDASVRLLQECLPIYRSLGDPSGITEVLYELGYLALRQGNNASARSLAEECLVLLRDHPDPYQEGHSRWLLGHIALAEGKHTEARSHYTQVMTNLYKQGNLWGVFFLLDSFARLGVAENQFERAAKLFGATERVGEIIRTSFNPVERVEHERAVAATRAALGETRFAAARAEGRAMASERAVAYALEEPAR